MRGRVCDAFFLFERLVCFSQREKKDGLCFHTELRVICRVARAVAHGSSVFDEERHDFIGTIVRETQSEDSQNNDAPRECRYITQNPRARGIRKQSGATLGQPKYSIRANNEPSATCIHTHQHRMTFGIAKNSGASRQKQSHAATASRALPR